MTVASSVEAPGPPAESVWEIDPGALLPGDVLLFANKAKVSWLIRWMTTSSTSELLWGSVSHAAIHLGDGIAIEANDPGIVQVYLPAVAHQRPEAVTIRRMEKLTLDQRKKLAALAVEHRHRPYSTRAALASVAPPLRLPNDPGRFCSQLVAASYEAIGHPLVDKPSDEYTPQDLLLTDRLGTRANCLREVPALAHAALAAILPTYESYLQRGHGYEKAILAQCNDWPGREWADVPNLSALLDRLSSLSAQERSLYDERLSRLIRIVLEQRPLPPPPSIGIGGHVLEQGQPLPPYPGRHFEALMASTAGSEYFTRSTQEIYHARNREIRELVTEMMGIKESFRKTGLRSYAALGLWVSRFYQLRMAYARWLSDVRSPGTVPADEKKAIEALLRNDLPPRDSGAAST